MSDNKKYYYLKLKDNYFDSDEMILLESMPDGYLYSNILLKLYLRSLKNNGKLMFREKIPYNPTVLAQVTRHHVGVVEKALNIFSDLGLIEVLDSGAIYISDIQNFIGKSSTEADRKREYRREIDNEIKAISKIGQMSDKYPPEIELDLELELELKLDKEKNIELKTNIENFFNKNWKLYPKKKGVGQISNTKKNKLFKLGEEFTRCINRYIKEIEVNKTEKQFIKNGSTFFNSGYLDYLDENYQETEETIIKMPEREEVMF